MMALSGKGFTGAGTPQPPSTKAGTTASSPPSAPPAPPVSKSRMPKVNLVHGGASQELPLEKTKLAQTKTKPTSMKNLAADTAVTQAMQAGISTAAMGAATHMNSGIGGSAVQQAGGIFSGIVARRKPSVTYVWGVLNAASTNVLQTDSPTLSVKFANP